MLLFFPFRRLSRSHPLSSDFDLIMNNDGRATQERNTPNVVSSTRAVQWHRDAQSGHIYFSSGTAKCPWLIYYQPGTVGEAFMLIERPLRHWMFSRLGDSSAQANATSCFGDLSTASQATHDIRKIKRSPISLFSRRETLIRFDCITSNSIVAKNLP